MLLLVYIANNALCRATRDPARAMRPAAILFLVEAINLPVVKY